MKKIILMAAVTTALVSCEPINDIGRVMVWKLESGAVVTDTIAPTTLFNEATDIANSRLDLELDSTDDAILDTTFTYLY